jgi:hypothetical protein
MSWLLLLMLMLTGGICPAYGTVQTFSEYGYDRGQFSGFLWQNRSVDVAAYGYDAKTVHKYLYAECDPVDNDDPSGHDIGDMLSVLDIGLTLANFSFPVFGSDSQRFLSPILDLEGNGNGFAYVIGASSTSSRSGTPWPFKKTIVESAAGVGQFKKDVAKIKADGKKISLLCLYGHGDQNQNLGFVGGAEISWTSLFPSSTPNVLNGPDISSTFKDTLWPDTTIMLEFCHSLDTSTIPDIFRKIAPQATIWGTHGEVYGYGNYGDIYSQYLEKYDK